MDDAVINEQKQNKTKRNSSIKMKWWRIKENVVIYK